MRKLVLLSGGLDSAVAAREADACSSIFVDYGQPSREREAAASQEVAHQLRLRLHVVQVAGYPAAIDGVVYTARNMMLVSIAAAVARSISLGAVVIGCTAADADGFTDCRAGYIEALRECTMPFGVRLEAPLLHLSRRDVRKLAAGISGTWSCYLGGETPCGRCLSCQQ